MHQKQLLTDRLRIVKVSTNQRSLWSLLWTNELGVLSWSVLCSREAGGSRTTRVAVHTQRIIHLILLSKSLIRVKLVRRPQPRGGELKTEDQWAKGFTFTLNCPVRTAPKVTVWTERDYPNGQRRVTRNQHSLQSILVQSDLMIKNHQNLWSKYFDIIWKSGDFNQLLCCHIFRGAENFYDATIIFVKWVILV